MPKEGKTFNKLSFKMKAVKLYLEKRIEVIRELLNNWGFLRNKSHVLSKAI
jgi:hypothetical protein